jgi:uncharacterized repeat protein (TIGR01451 family)
MLGQNRWLAAALLPLISFLAQPTNILAVGFTSAKNYSVGRSPIGIATRDFNKDGKLDLCVANSGSLSVSILLGSGDGTFLPPVNYKVPQTPKSIAVGDFNHDGRLDVAVANAGSISVLLGYGNGTFKSAVNTSGGKAFDSLAVGDFNRDGKLDVAVTNGGNISVLLGKGDGTFGPTVNYGTGGSAVSVKVGDFNRDNKLDLAVADSVTVTSETFGGHVSILLGNGNGTFQPAVAYPVGGRPSAIAIGDFNHNGALDLVVTARPNIFAPYQINVLLGNGRGAFGAPVVFDRYASNISVAIGDFNADGKPDLAASSISFIKPGVGLVFVPSVRILLGNGDGTFQSARTFVQSLSPGPLTAGNFNGDNLPEIAMTNVGSTVGVLLNTSARTGTDVAANIFSGGNVEDLIYTVVANNRGPKGATNVVLTDTLPTNVTFVSSDSTQGFCSRTGSGVRCDFGSLAAGAIAFVRIEVLTPTPPWTLVDSAGVTANEFDPNTMNNNATLSFTYNP